MASKLIVFPFFVGMVSSLNEVVSKYDIVTMDKSRKFEVKTNSKIKESQDNANLISNFKKGDYLIRLAS